MSKYHPISKEGKVNQHVREIERMKRVRRDLRPLSGYGGEMRVQRRVEQKARPDRSALGILDAIRQLMAPPDPKAKRPIGFVTPKSDE